MNQKTVFFRAVIFSVLLIFLGSVFAQEVNDDKELTAINTPETFSEHLCLEGQVQVILTNSEQTMCVSRELAEKWLLTGYVSEIRFNTPSASYPCKSSRYVQVTITSTGTQTCALESTARSWERRGFAIRTQGITIFPETKLLAESTVPLIECEEKHAIVRLADDIPTFCMDKNIAERWVNEKFAFKVPNRAEKLTIISVSQIFPKYLCTLRQVKIIVADGEEIICTSKAIVQKWVSTGFATKVDG